MIKFDLPVLGIDPKPRASSVTQWCNTLTTTPLPHPKVLKERKIEMANIVSLKLKCNHFILQKNVHTLQVSVYNFLPAKETEQKYYFFV